MEGDFGEILPKGKAADGLPAAFLDLGNGRLQDELDLELFPAVGLDGSVAGEGTGQLSAESACR